MTKLHDKSPRLRLDPERYKALHRLVLERDGWRCQSCGSHVGLEVHHITPRSKLGHDAEENLITLCLECHWQIHSG
jgi:5-methylcytosine-specific restriction endonuclease McrA